MSDVSPVGDGRHSKTKPQKNAGATTATTFEQFMDDDDVVNLIALKRRLAEALAKGDVHERDLKSISVEYRAVRLELQEAQERAEAAELGRRRSGAGSAGSRSFNGDI